MDPATIAAALEDVELVANALTVGAGVIASIKTAITSNDPAALSAAHAQALAFANSVAPAGAAPQV